MNNNRSLSRIKSASEQIYWEVKQIMKYKKVIKGLAGIVLFCSATALILNGCGGDKAPTPTPSATTASGVASLDAVANGTVSVKGSAAYSPEKTTSISSNGSYTVDVRGLIPPFILKAEGVGQAGDTQVLYSISRNGGQVNINPISDIAVAATADANATNGGALYTVRSGDEWHRRTTDNFYTVINNLRTVLAPLFALYQVSGNGVNDDDNEFEHDKSGLRAMLHDVRFVIRQKTVTVTNRQTGGLIFSAPLNNLSSGTFYPENLPAGTGGGSTSCTSFTYSDWGTCQSDNTQTRTVASSSPAGCTGGTPVLTQSCTYVPGPAACTYTYNAWGACQSNGTQTRTVATSSPAGCVGIPVLSQACTYVPTVTACTSFTYSGWGTCQADNTQTRTVATSSPAGCTGGTPVLSQACTYVPPVTACTSFTYNAWGACQSNNTQSRTVATSSPAGCTGGTPVLSQACTYVPPVTTCTSFTYSAWGTCQSNNTQTRTQLTASPAGCTGGTPVLSQSCTYVPPAQTCGTCHAIPPSTGAHSFHVTSRGYQCSTCHGTGYSSTAVTAATHINGVSNLVSTLNFNTATNTCGSPGCHASRTW